MAVAVLAYETWHGRHGTLPAFTGVRHPVLMGSHQPRAAGCRAMTDRTPHDRGPQSALEPLWTPLSSARYRQR